VSHLIAAALLTHSIIKAQKAPKAEKSSGKAEDKEPKERELKVDADPDDEKLLARVGNCRFYEQKFPEVDDVVVVEVKRFVLTTPSKQPSTMITLFFFHLFPILFIIHLFFIFGGKQYRTNGSVREIERIQ
jgi:hypothetical protein